MTTAYDSEHRRVERALVVRLFSDWLRSAIAHTNARHGRPHEGQVQCLELLFEAENEALDGAPDRDKLEARVDRLAGVADRVTRGLKPHAPKAMLLGAKAPNLASVFLQHTYVLKALTDSGVLVMDAGSRFDVAYTAMADAINGAKVGDLLATVDRSATKRARRVLKAFQAEGYWLGASITTTTEAEGTPA